MDLTSYFLISVLVLILEQEAHAVISAPGPRAEEGPPTQLPPRPARRARRCSCENLKDKECVYFCHIGIVWVNTPSQVVPYGVGSIRLRRQVRGRERRDVTRCLCTKTNDWECLQFCSHWNLRKEGENAPVKRHPSRKSKERYKAESTKRNRHSG